MQIDHESFCLGVFGSKGSGKTTWGLKYLANSPARVRFLFDFEGEFAIRFGLPKAGTAEEIAAAIETGWVCFDPWREFRGRKEAAFEFFCEVVMNQCRGMDGRKFFVVDELQRFVTAHNVPEALEEIIWVGRRAGIDCVFISQQPNLLCNSVREQITEACCFQLRDENAVKWPQSFGFDVEEVQNLGKHQWVCRDKWGNEARSFRKGVTFQERETAN